MLSLMILATFSMQAQSGTALDFDGSNDRVRMQGLNLTSSITIEAWVRPTPKTNFSTILSNKYGGLGNPGFVFAINTWNSSNRRLLLETRGREAISSGTVTWNVWQHVAVTVSGNIVRFYINGNLVGTSSQVNLQASSYPTYIGDFAVFFGGGKYKGRMDELRVWSYARSQGQIQADMNCEIAGNESGLIGYYKFNNGTAGGNNAGVTNLPDESSYNNYGTLQSFALSGATSNWVAPGGISCTSGCTDNDNDGYDDVACGGDDCDDDDPNINPGATELCDGIDNNCDGNIDEGLTDPDVSISESDLPDFCQGLTVLTADINNIGDLQTPITYLWSTGETTESIVVDAAGNYAVDVTEGGGCEGSDDHDVLTNAWDVLSGYVMIGYEVDIDGNTVAGGGVGVNGAGEKAKLRGGTVVDEFVKAPIISKSGGSSAGHEEIGQVTVTLPTFLYSSPNSDDITVPTGGSTTLTGSTYGEIEVKKNATVTFDAAEVHIEDLDVEDGGTVIFSQDATLLIEDDFNLDEDCAFNTAGNFVMVYVGDRAYIDEGSEVHARMYALDKIWAKKAASDNHTTMTGMFISEDKVDGDEYVDWNWDGSCGLPLVPSSFIAPIDDNPMDDVIIADFSAKSDLETPELSLYPNPARDILNIEIEGMESAETVLIFDAMGRLVWELVLQEGQNSLQADLSGNAFQNGLYVVSVISKDERVTKRLVISK